MVCIISCHYSRYHLFNTCLTTSFLVSAAFVKALNGIHNAGIVHTDLRIDNLTINDNGEVFIIDFDCAEHLVRQNDYFGYEDMKEMMSAIGWGEDSDSADNE